jgi:hypothetical protein
MNHIQYIPSFYFYKFANAISAPYTALSAYSNGLIDESGNIISNEGSLDDFEYFVIKLKKIFEDLPPGLTKSRLTNVSSIMQLFSEEIEKIGITQEQLICLIEAHVILNSDNTVSFIELLEDIGTGAMSTGSNPGELGTPAEAPEANKGNVSGYDPRLGEILTRSQPVNMFANVEMFSVPSQEFKAFKQSKTWRHLPDSPTKRYLQRFQRRNKEGKMAVRDESSGEIFFVPYKEKSFMEEFNLEGLSILSEQRDFTEPFRAALDALRRGNETDNDGKVTRGESGERFAQIVANISNLSNAIKHAGIQSDVVDKSIEIAQKQADKPVAKHGTDAYLWTPDGDFQEVDAKQVDADRGRRIYPGDEPHELIAGLPEYQDLMKGLRSGAPIEALKGLNRRFREQTKQIAPGVRTISDPSKLSPQQSANQTILTKFVAGTPTMPQAFIRTPGKKTPNYWGTGTVPLVPKEVLSAASGESRATFNTRVFQRKIKDGKQMPPESEIFVRGGNPFSRGAMERMRQLSGLKPGEPIRNWSASFQDVNRYGKSRGQEIYDLRIGEQDWNVIKPHLNADVAAEYEKILRDIG